MVTLEQIQEGLGNYVESELVAKVPGLRKWALALVATPAILQVRTLAEGNKEMLMKAGYMSEDGMIDIDRLCRELKEVAHREGEVTEHIPMLGTFRFSETDIDKLRSFIT